VDSANQLSHVEAALVIRTLDADAKAAAEVTPWRALTVAGAPPTSTATRPCATSPGNWPRDGRP